MNSKYLHVQKTKFMLTQAIFFSPGCSVILDTNDSNWEEYFTQAELQEINEAACIEKQPADLQQFFDAIPRTTDISEVFSHLNNLVIDPFENRGLYWLKKMLQNSADLLITRCLAITDEQETDIIRRVWSCVNEAFDGSDLKLRRYERILIAIQHSTNLSII